MLVLLCFNVSHGNLENITIQMLHVVHVVSLPGILQFFLSNCRFLSPTSLTRQGLIAKKEGFRAGKKILLILNVSFSCLFSQQKIMSRKTRWKIFTMRVGGLFFWCVHHPHLFTRLTTVINIEIFSTSMLT